MGLWWLFFTALKMAASRGGWAPEPFSAPAEGKPREGSWLQELSVAPKAVTGRAVRDGAGSIASAQPPLAFERLKRGAGGGYFVGEKGLVPPLLRGRIPKNGWLPRSSVLPSAPPGGWVGSGGVAEVCGSVGWPGASSMPKPWGALDRAVPSSSLPPHKGRRL